MAKTELPVVSGPRDSQPVDILIIANEHSGDEQAARLISKLKGQHPGLNIAAMGGEHLHNAGAHLIFNPLDHAVVGLIEVLKHIDYFKSLIQQTVDWVKTHKPRIVCFIDAPSFNLRIAERLYKAGIARKAGGEIPLVYYISPQIWAWKAKRRFKMARFLDSLATIFPFEPDYYKDTDLPVQFVGHPFVEPEYTSILSYDHDAPLLILPGSRRTPIQRILPNLLGAYELLLKDFPDLPATIVYPSDKIKTLLESILADKGLGEKISLISNDTQVSARAVMMSSGTMSLDCALAGIPGLIAYKASYWTYFIATKIIGIKDLGIANIILKEPIHPEFLQFEMNPDKLSAQMKKVLTQPEYIEKTHFLRDRLIEMLKQPNDLSASNWLYSELQKTQSK